MQRIGKGVKESRKERATAGQQYGGKKKGRKEKCTNMGFAFVSNFMWMPLWSFVCACWVLSVFRLPLARGIELYRQHVCHLGPVVVIPQIPPWGDGWDRCSPLQTLQWRRHFPRTLHHRVHHRRRWVDWLRWGSKLNFNSSTLGWSCLLWGKSL